MSLEWLPALVLLEKSDGNWAAYEEVLYGFFRADFVESKPSWPDKEVRLKRYPVEKQKEATFWHFISEGAIEADRKIDLRRCERIRWPRQIIDSFPNAQPEPEHRILWWVNRRRNEDRYVLALPDFSYVVVVADRGRYVMPWTAYCVQHEHQRVKLRKEWAAFWKA